MSDSFKVTEAEDNITIEILPNKRSFIKTVLLLKGLGFSFTGIIFRTLYFKSTF